MTTRILPALLAASLLLGCATLANAAGLYQWKDAKGVTHFADAPPPKGHFTARDVHPGDPAPAAPDAAKPTPASTNCSLAQANLKLLQAGGAIGVDADGDGKPDGAMTADERVKQTELAQKNIGAFCSNGAPAASP
ncbi:DUF4124 domain-containing protein [Cognatiluteimonas profundi]|uniref:DUF4124 domain-containing protein n=1 Tax=Cognatiluteimonas profundi TaxID=2594501 RepID=UPI00131E8C85|nr:DUF4124 domain-containing protein [Lysobacter profundi]